MNSPLSPFFQPERKENFSGEEEEEEEKRSKEREAGRAGRQIDFLLFALERLEDGKVGAYLGT